MSTPTKIDLEHMPTPIRNRVLSPPRQGSGLHKWIFATACILVDAGWDDSEILEHISPLADDAGREDVPEIQRQIAGARQTCAQKAVSDAPGCPGNPPTLLPRVRRPEIVDAALLRAVLHENGARNLAWWAARSPVKDPQTMKPVDVLGLMFREINPLVWIGMTNMAIHPVYPLVGVPPALNRAQFCVPSPMSARTGKTQLGKESHRCLDNAGPREYIVVDIDRIKVSPEAEPENMPYDWQAAVHAHLSQYLTLRMMLSSGGKSLHGWYDVADKTEEDVHHFMQVAVKLGADDAMLNRSQPARLPNGLRRDKATRNVVAVQRVIYLDPPEPNDPF